MSSPDIEEYADRKEAIFGWKVPGSRYAPGPHIPAKPHYDSSGGVTKEATVEEIQRVITEPRRPLLRQGTFLVTDHGVFEVKKGDRV